MWRQWIRGLEGGSGNECFSGCSVHEYWKILEEELVCINYDECITNEEVNCEDWFDAQDQLDIDNTLGIKEFSL